MKLFERVTEILQEDFETYRELAWYNSLNAEEFADVVNASKFDWVDNDDIEFELADGLTLTAHDNEDIVIDGASIETCITINDLIRSAVIKTELNIPLQQAIAVGKIRSIMINGHEHMFTVNKLYLKKLFNNNWNGNDVIDIIIYARS